MTFTIAALGQMSREELAALTPEQLASEEWQQNALDIAHELNSTWGGEDGRAPNTRGRVVGYGSQGEQVRAVQLITRAAAARDGIQDDRDMLVIDGIYGNNTRAAVTATQSALGEKDDAIAGKYYARATINAIAGLQVPQGQSVRERRRALQTTMSSAPDQFARASGVEGAAPTPGPTQVAAPQGGEVRDAETAGAAIRAATALPPEQQYTEYQRIDGAIRALPAEADRAAINAAVAAGLAEAGPFAALHYIGANRDADHSQIITAFKGNQQLWDGMRTMAAGLEDKGGLPAGLLNDLAGQEPTGSVSNEQLQTWRALRDGAIANTPMEQLQQNDLRHLVRFHPTMAGSLMASYAGNDPQRTALAVSVLQERFVDLFQRGKIGAGPDSVAGLAQTYLGSTEGTPTAHDRARWNVVNSALNGLFTGNMSDDTRITLYRSFAGQQIHPALTTMTNQQYGVFDGAAYASSSSWWWKRANWIEEDQQRVADARARTVGLRADATPAS